MNSRVMLIVAMLLVLAAGIAGYFGYRTTVDAREEAKAAQLAVKQVRAEVAADVSSKTPVVVALRPIAAFQKVTAEDIGLDYLHLPPPNSFQHLEDLLGKVIQADAAIGELIERKHLQPGGDIARLLKPGERAVAIGIDEVVGGGGFVQPGDSVDVLMYVPGDNRPSSSAQIVLRALRVVGLGTQMVVNDSASPVASQSDPAAAREARRQARTAVLAVSEADITRLMLASSVGILRLAIRPSDETLADTGNAPAGRTEAKSNRLVRTGALLANQEVPRRASVASTPRPAARVSQPAYVPIVIFRGLNNGSNP